jgi:hypothetical protein
MSSINQNNSGATSPKTVETSKWDVYTYDNSNDYKQKYNELSVTFYFDTEVKNSKEKVVQEIAMFLNNSQYDYSIDMFSLGYKEDDNE